MRRSLPVLVLLLVWTGAVHAHGLLIPEDKQVPPLAMLNHKVNIAIDDQVAVTKVEQTFRNHTDRQLEAKYIFPVPKGASVNKFTMWVNGKEVTGELVEAAKAREIYTSIVRRTQDPGLLEYIGNNLLQMRVFPIPAHSDQKVSLNYTSVAPRDASLVEYIYPLKTDGKATATLEDFAITATIKSQHAVQNVYSPTHAIALKRANDKEVSVHFERNQGLLDKDFQLFYQVGDKDVGLTALTHRPISGENGYFMLLITPKVEIAKEYQVTRDMVLVLDTSGSMRGAKMDQAKKALRYCLDNLTAKDRFAMINFATTINTYKNGLTEVNAEQVTQAKKWVDNLEATGGTAINDALQTALDLRSKDEGRIFNIVFFTDGQPTIGETKTAKILKNVEAKNSTNTRIFTFGVGESDGLNATFLDQLAENTKALSTFVRPSEDIEAKVSGLYSKISHPVLANLKLTATNDMNLSEVYAPQLPDLFHGQQLIVMGRYSGSGAAALRLTGTVGMETKEFVYEMNFPAKTNDDRTFVEHLWARRKVGYVLDEIRRNGEKKELVDEVVTLAKKYGITTPYTSWLIVPDAPVPVVSTDPKGGSAATAGRMTTPPALKGSAEDREKGVADFAIQLKEKPGELATKRGEYQERTLDEEAKKGDGKEGPGKAEKDALDKKNSYDKAREALANRDYRQVQTERLGVELSMQMNNLRNQHRLEQTAYRNVAGRNCMEIGGVWIDDRFDAKMPLVTVKAQSDAYFRILERQPKMKEVFQLGNHLVWVAPNGTALVIDTKDGKEKLDDAEIDKLFVVKK